VDDDHSRPDALAMMMMMMMMMMMTMSSPRAAPHVACRL
jgi:hypothetical protein